MSNAPTPEESAEPTDAPKDSQEAAVESTAKATEETGNPNAEAARYRTRLRETEAERDTIAGQLEKYQRREAQRLATDLSKPADLWLDGTDVADVLDDDGQVDPVAVAAIQAKVLEGRPGLSNQRPAPRPDPSQGARGGPTTGDDWAAVLRGPARR